MFFTEHFSLEIVYAIFPYFLIFGKILNVTLPFQKMIYSNKILQLHISTYWHNNGQKYLFYLETLLTNIVVYNNCRHHLKKYLIVFLLNKNKVLQSVK